MNIDDAMGIAHPHFSIRDTFLTEAKRVVAFLERESSRLGYDIICSDIEITNEHLSFNAKNVATMAEDKRYAEFMLWFDDGELMVAETGYGSVQATQAVIMDLIKRWAPESEYEYQLSPYHADHERFEK